MSAGGIGSSRASSYGLLAAVVAALLFAGLAVPFVFGDPAPASFTAASPGSPSAAGGGASTGAGGIAAPTTLPSGNTAGAAGDTGAALPRPGAQTGGPGSGIVPAAGGGAPLAASDRGVTAASVRVGFTLVDLGPAAPAGSAINFPTTETQQGWWQASVDEVNAHGGINGRRIEPVFQRVNVLDSAQAQAACVALTEDHEVFAVVGVLYFPVADECVVTAHDTPLSTIGPNDDSTYRSGRLVTLMPRTSRVIAQFGGDLVARGELAGKNVGILGDAGSDPRGEAMRQLEAIVRGGGAASVRTATLGTDLASAAPQTALIVNNWRSNGVDTVMFIVNPTYAIAFVQNADRQFWKPMYYASDFANMGNSDVATLGMSSGFDGAVAITTTTVNRVPPSPPFGVCLDVLARNGHPVEDERQSGLAAQQCDMFNVFLAGAVRAGVDLTRSTFADGIQRAGSVPTWRIGGGAFGPGKFDMADLVGTVRWKADCSCWRPEGDFRPGAA